MGEIVTVSVGSKPGGWPNEDGGGSDDVAVCRLGELDGDMGERRQGNWNDQKRREFEGEATKIL